MHFPDLPFQCKFEDYNDKYCNMRRILYDDTNPDGKKLQNNPEENYGFAWQRISGGTPTSYTGPNSAYSSYFYIYTESTYAKSGDIAV